MRKLFITIIILFCLSNIIIGCSIKGDKESAYSMENKKKVSRTIHDDTWNVKLLLYWDKNEVVGITQADYKGTKNLKTVTVKPNFTKAKWPIGYIPLTLGKYTWNSDTKSGAIPESSDVSTRSSSKTISSPKLMTVNEAWEILNNTEVTIEWEETSGEHKTALIK